MRCARSYARRWRVADRVRVAGVDEVDDQHVALLVDVDRDLVGRLAGEHAPERDAVARAVRARDLDEARAARAPRRQKRAVRQLPRAISTAVCASTRAERDEPGHAPAWPAARRRSRGRSATASTRPSSEPDQRVARLQRSSAPAGRCP